MSLDMPRYRKQKFLSPGLHKKSPKQEMLKSSPPISKKSPKYADHPPNAGHGFAALALGSLAIAVGIFVFLFKMLTL